MLAAFADWIVAVTAPRAAGMASSDPSGDVSRHLPRQILVGERGRNRLVEVEAVDWLEAQGDYVRLHEGDRTHLVSKSLTEMEKLLETRGFLRIHRGALVNLDRARELHPLGGGRYMLRLSIGTELENLLDRPPGWRRGQSPSLVGSVMLTP